MEKPRRSRHECGKLRRKYGKRQLQLHAETRKRPVADRLIRELCYFLKYNGETKMDEKRKTKISKFLSLVLRHKPEEIGLTLGENGWADVAALQAACAAYGKTFTFAELEEVVETSDKKRFAFNETRTEIRASQGHSLDIEIEFESKAPPATLYHGTAEKNVGAIFAGGLQKMKRHHVHLSADTETAYKVGARHGKPVIFVIKTESMCAEGFEFFISANGVWLVREVPPKFLEVYEP
jgi:putative RNA 2'-phosphotransferase